MAKQFVADFTRIVTDHFLFESVANIYLTINEWGWVSYEELWRSRRVLSIVLLFIQNNSLFKNIAKTCLPPSMLSSYVFVCVHLSLSSSANILQIADVALRVVFVLFLLCFLPLVRLVPAVVFTLETSEVFLQQKQLNLVPGLFG